MFGSLLQVNWDDGIDPNRQNRVSPWEIEPSSPVPASSNALVPGSKRPKVGVPSIKADFPVPGMPLHHSYCRNSH